MGGAKVAPSGACQLVVGGFVFVSFGEDWIGIKEREKGSLWVLIRRDQSEAAGLDEWTRHEWRAETHRRRNSVPSRDQPA